MEKVLELITQFDGKIYDLCYELLHDNDRQSEVFQFVCEKLLKKPENPQIQIKRYFDESEIKEYETIYGDIINGIITSAIKKCDYGIIKPEEFYKNVWESYCINFESLKERAFAFYYTLIDMKIPYTYIGKPLSMSNEKYREIIKNNEDSIEKVKYIFKVSYPQKTEIASLILKCIDDIDDYESKVVVLAKTLDAYCMEKSSIKGVSMEKMLQKINRKIKELEKD